MRVAHLILVHKNPHQVEKLIKLLQHKDCDVFIHLDKKSNFDDFKFLCDLENVFFVRNNIKVYWAAYSLVRCMLNSFEEILAKDKQYDYINVISGQDLPIKPVSSFIDYLTKFKGNEFIVTKSHENEWPQVKERLEHYDLPGVRIKGKYFAVSIMNKVLPPKKFPIDSYNIVGGSQWFTITTNATGYILNTLKTNRKIIRYFKLTWASDELIFATLLFNSDFKNKIVDNLMYVDWAEVSDGHPKILKANDFEKLKNCNKYFARKFDEDVDRNVIEAVVALVTKPL